MRSPFWKSTAIIVMYDDSDGWYDHQMSPIVNPSAVNTGSASNSDGLNATGVCGHGTALAGVLGRCGYGPRLPLLVVSPFAKANFVDHTLTDQTRCCALSRRTGAPGRSAAGHSTRWPARSGTCSTSKIAASEVPASGC